MSFKYEAEWVDINKFSLDRQLEAIQKLERCILMNKREIEIDWMIAMLEKRVASIPLTLEEWDANEDAEVELAMYKGLKAAIDKEEKTYEQI